MPPTGFHLIPRELHIIHAARDLAALIDLPINPWNSAHIPVLAEQAQAVLGRPGNAAIELRASAGLPGIGRQIAQHKTSTERKSPVFLNQPPAAIPSGEKHFANTREINLISIPNGAICHFAGVPVVIGPDQRTVIADCSSYYAGLVHFYDVSIPQLLADSAYLDAVVFVLFIDADPRNYCHWLLDFLPRLAHLRGRMRHTDVYLATPPITTPFQRETLRLCGFDDSRIIPLENFATLRAREILILDDGQDFNHPAHNAAPWAVDYLRSTIGLACAAGAGVEPRPRKIFISRSDAARRRVTNEPALMPLLASHGYECIVPSTLSFREQIATFAGASHIIGPHGAGLTNLIFSRAGSQVIELFAGAVGTPAYYMLCAGTNRPYYAYLAGSAAGEDDMVVDVAEFARCAGAYL